MTDARAARRPAATPLFGRRGRQSRWPSQWCSAARSRAPAAHHRGRRGLRCSRSGGRGCSWSPQGWSRPRCKPRAEAGLHPIESAHIRKVVTLVSDPSPTFGGVRALIRSEGRRLEVRASGSAAGAISVSLAGEQVAVEGTTRPARRATVGCGCITRSAFSRRRRPSGSAPVLRLGGRPTRSAACSSGAQSRSLRVRGHCSAGSCSATIATSRRPCPTTSGPPGSLTCLPSRGRTWRSSSRCSRHSYAGSVSAAAGR